MPLSPTDGIQLKYESSPPTLTSGQTVQARCDSSGALVTTATIDSEFPAAAALSDNFANPTTTTVGAMGMIWDGATWDRAPGDSTNGAKINETLAPTYEDNTLGKAVVEHRYTNGRVTADGQIKSSAGFIHKVTFAATGTVTAGVITIYDSLTETGTIIWSGTIQVTTAPVTIHLNVPTSTGIYVGYDGTIANVSTTIAYR